MSAQMGSGVNRAVFTNRVAEGLKRWHYNARRNLSKHRSISSEHSPRSMPATADTSVRDMQKSQAEEHYQVPPVEVTRSTTSEITEEAMQNNSNTNTTTTSFLPMAFPKEKLNHKISFGGSYDGEVSFGSSWKIIETGNSIRYDNSIIEEHGSDILADFDEQAN